MPAAGRSLPARGTHVNNGNTGRVARSAVSRRRIAVSARLGGGGGLPFNLPKGVDIVPEGGGMMGGGGPGGQAPATADPTGLFNGIPLAAGIIEKRMNKKRVETDKEFAAKFEAAVAKYKDEDMAEAEMRRQARTPPEDPYDLVEYFLDTMADDMEYEVARCRPMLTPAFFAALDKLVGNERFAPEPDQERIAELEMVRQYLAEGSKAVDAAVQATTSAVERMKKLLGAKDKKQMILDMAEANEIDMALMDLLQQNIEAARVAGQAEAAAFMEKVRTAAGKFAVSAPTTAGLAPAMPAAPGAASSDSPPAIGGISVVDGSAAVAAAERAARRQATTGLIYDSAALRKPAAAPAAPPAPPAQKPAGGSGLILP